MSKIKRQMPYLLARFARSRMALVYNFAMKTTPQYLSWLLIGVLSTTLLGACGSSPKGADARAYARVKDWRSSLNLRSLEQEYNLPKGLLSAVMHQESGGKAGARSHVGAQGLFQIMPATARELNLNNAYHPESAAEAAARYLSRLYRHYRGNLKMTLAAYNWGIGNVDRYRQNEGNSLSGMPQETRNYVARVTQLRKFYD